jgi:hypothetical protein
MRTLVLATSGRHVFLGLYNHGDWYDDGTPDGRDARVTNVTHWQPLPEPPTPLEERSTDPE